MSISSVTNRVSYTGNGAVDTYDYTFRIFTNTDLLVVVKNTSTNVETTLTLTTDYTVTGVGNGSGGTVVLVNASQAWLDGDGDLATGYTITIRRKLPLTQTTDIRNQGDFFPESHEDEFDKSRMIDQQQQDELDRAPKLTEGVLSANFDPTLPADIATANVTIKVNSSGNGFEVGPTSEEISGAAASATAASASATEAEEWANKTTGLVESTEYSAKAYAVGGTGVTDASGRGAAKEWATKAEDSTVDGTEYSAKHYSAKSSASATSAAASLVAAQNAVASVIWNDVVFITNADSPYSVTNSQRGKLISVDASGGAVVVNLPQISTLDLSSPFVLGIKKTDSSANTVTINRSGTDVIDGSSSKAINVSNSGTTLIPDTDPSPDYWTSSDFGSSAGNLSVDNFNGDGSTVAFTLSTDPGSENNTFVWIDGVYQQKDTYSMSGTTLTFTEAPPSGTDNIEVVIGTLLSIGTPADSTVTRSKMTLGATAPVNNTSKTAAYTVTTSDDIIYCDSSGGAFTVTMPTEASASGRVFVIKKTSSDFNAVTINDDSGTEISKLNTDGETAQIQTDGTNWFVLNKYIPSIVTTYTPGSQGFGTISSVDFLYHRSGGFLDIQGRFTCGTSTATQARINLPTGLTIDSDLGGSVAVGHGGYEGTSGQDILVIAGGSNGYLNFALHDASSDGLAVQNGSSIASSGLDVSFFARVPITDWSS